MARARLGRDLRLPERRLRWLGAFEALRKQGLLYPCFCSRAELHAASAPSSDGTPIYAGTCRGLSAEDAARRRAERPGAWRLRVPSADDPRGDVAFTDRVYGPQHETLARDCGDFLVRRSDGVFAYQLAVCVDDAEMGVNEVVRGRDLLGSSARQMYLQDLLDLPIPHTRTCRCLSPRTAGASPSASGTAIWASCERASARPRRCWAWWRTQRASRPTHVRAARVTLWSSSAGRPCATIREPGGGRTAIADARDRPAPSPSRADAQVNPAPIQKRRAPIWMLAFHPANSQLIRYPSI